MERTRSTLTNVVIAGIDRIRLRTFAAVASAVVLLFALIFNWLTANGAGLTGTGGENIGFAQSLYFSVVTFTSLGYGDIVPTGWARLFACCEVILGLAFFGVGIAKLSSARQAYYLGQLYARNAQEMLRQFVIRLRELVSKYTGTLAELKEAKSPTNALGSLHLEARTLLTQIDSYLSFEIQNGDFLGEIPKGPVTRVLHTGAKLAVVMTAVATFRRSLHSQKQRFMARALIQQIGRFGELVRANTKESAMSAEANALIQRCNASDAELQRVYDEVAAAQKQHGRNGAAGLQ
jgi:hypothetical protein